MIIVQLIGGLGNQMFQYALGQRLAMDRHVPLKLDISWFPTQTLRRYQLDQFNIRAESATQNEIAQLRRHIQADLVSRGFRIIQNWLPYYKRRFIHQIGKRFDAHILQSPKQVMLVGYWQSEKYFKTIQPVLQQDFTLKEPLGRESRETAETIQSSSAVSLHIRRGDYVSNASTYRVHGICSLEYYREAVAYINKTVKEPHFSFFRMTTIGQSII